LSVKFTSYKNEVFSEFDRAIQNVLEETGGKNDWKANAIYGLSDVVRYKV